MPFPAELTVTVVAIEPGALTNEPKLACIPGLYDDTGAQTEFPSGPRYISPKTMAAGAAISVWSSTFDQLSIPTDTSSIQTVITLVPRQQLDRASKSQLSATKV